MIVLAKFMAIISMVIIAFGFLLIQGGHRIGRWKRLTRSEKAWQRKIAYFAFNYVLPAGIVTTVVLVPLLVLMGFITFVAMLIL